MYRIGQSQDRHPLVAGRPCVLGGVPFPEADDGPVGHSDADVLTHAVIDALLGAAGLDDIGTYFPDTDPGWAGADSLDLLRRTVAFVTGAGFRIVNVDSTVIAERPRIATRRAAMRARLAEAMAIPAARVNVKATRGEGLGPEGRGECITAQAVVLLQSLDASSLDGSREGR
ncbi:MAG: 2-C-methyl-D-erythritol 2,4-cyclodiphosphate synthase [Candidatus Krumholzibacteriia bacterium]